MAVAAGPVGEGRRAWYAVALLCALFVFSHIDRAAVVVLAQPLATDLVLSDGELALLIGAAFALVYSVAGLPVAALIDRTGRKWIIAVGALLWAVATIASGFASDFKTLAMLRAGVALGEAVLTPGAISLIADLFPPEKRLRPTAIFSSINALMGVGSLVVVGALFRVAEMPVFATDLATWRTVLIMIGIPPLLLALAFVATVREPARSAPDPAAVPVAGDGGLLAYLRGSWPILLPFYVGAGALSFFIYGAIAWVPTIFQRSFGMTTAAAGVTLGTMGLGCGLAGALLWPAVVALLTRRGVAHPALLAMAIASIVFGPFLVAGPASGDLRWFIALLAVGMLGTAVVGVLPAIVVQTYGASHVRARLMALLLLAQNLIGLGLGPTVVAALAKSFPGHPNALGISLALTGGVTSAIAGISFLLARRACRRADLMQGS